MIAAATSSAPYYSGPPEEQIEVACRRCERMYVGTRGYLLSNGFEHDQKEGWGGYWSVEEGDDENAGTLFRIIATCPACLR